jgi:transcription antitermination factor NusG
MSTAGHFTEHPQMPLSGADVCWYAVQTRSRHERVVAAQLREQGVSNFLPMITQIYGDGATGASWWSFRFFLGTYLSMRRFLLRSIVLFSRGVAGFVAMRGEPVSIPDEQIDNVKELLAKNIRCAAHPFLKVGQRVRIRGGSLEGLEGILVSHNGDRKLVISVNTIERSFSIGIKGYDVEVL